MKDMNVLKIGTSFFITPVLSNAASALNKLATLLISLILNIWFARIFDNVY